MHVEHDEAAAAVADGLHTLLHVVTRLDDRELIAASRCHGWSVADVLVHVHLGLQEMLLAVVDAVDAVGEPDEPGARSKENPGLEPDTDAATYWRAEVPTNDPDADPLAHVRFARLVAAAYRRPAGLVAHLTPTVEGVARAVRRMPPGPVRFQGRVLSSGDFLATWAVEVAVHHLDLGRDLDLAPPAPAALTLARRTVEALAGGPLPAQWSDEVAVLLGTGRIPLDDDHRRQAGPLAEQLPSM